MPKHGARRAFPRASRGLLAFTLCSTLLTACASSGASSSGRSPNLITGSELDDLRRSGVPDLHELITRARPRWLQIRNERSLQLETTILVYHHDTRLGGVEVLRGYPLTSITSIRYLDAAQAGVLPGAGSAHVQAAIVISTSGS